MLLPPERRARRPRADVYCDARPGVVRDAVRDAQKAQEAVKQTEAKVIAARRVAETAGKALEAKKQKVQSIITIKILEHRRGGPFGRAREYLVATR